MGFFQSKFCPICGGTAPKLLAKKVDGQALCRACADNIMADADLVKQWSVEDLRTHLKAREDNLKILDNFTPSRSIEYEYEAVIDDAKRLFYIKEFTVDNPPVFSFDDIVGFQVALGYRTVESWCRGMERIPYKPIELGVIGGAVAFAEILSDKEDEYESENLTVTLKVNTPYLHEYELCNIVVDGNSKTEYAIHLSQEIAKVNLVCDLMVSLTAIEAND